MGRAKLQRSGHCLHGTHERCPHSSDVAVGVPWRPRPRAEHVLTVCVCDCHVTCPLAGQGTVVRELWGQQCACPGAGLVRERQERAEELRRGVAGVVAEVKRERPSSPEEIETRLRAVYARHGEPPPPGLTGWSRLAAAGTARRGTRSPRLLAMGIRAVAGAVRWAWQPGGTDGGNRAEARKLYRGIGVVALLAALLTASAVRSSGGRRLSLAAGASLAWLTTIWFTALGTAVARISQLADDHPVAGETSPSRLPEA